MTAAEGAPLSKSVDRAVLPPGGGENGPVNLVRITAALFVVLEHTRAVFFVDFDDAPQNAVQAGLYGVSAIGHQAVVVFFVLSGFWVGGSAMRKAQRGTFRWMPYIVDRVTRLWIVLLPALVLTLVLDLVGRHFFGHMSAYTGDERYVGAVSSTAHPIDGVTFFGNLFFFGEIRVDTFGSNTSLWSLGYEFWMYVIAPLLMFALLFLGRRSFLYIVLAAAFGVLVGLDVVLYVPIWMLGTAVAMNKKRLDALAARIRPRTLIAARLGFSAVVLGVAVFARGTERLPVWLEDYLVAIPSALLLASMTTGFIKKSTEKTLLGRYADLANSSYSLYVIHLPVLVLLVSALGVEVGNRWPSDALHWFYLLLIVAGMTVLGWLFAQGTERHTNVIRSAVKRVLRISG